MEAVKEVLGGVPRRTRSPNSSLRGRSFVARDIQARHAVTLGFSVASKGVVFSVFVWSTIGPGSGTPTLARISMPGIERICVPGGLGSRHR